MTKRCSNKSVGILVWKNNKLLLIERKLFPFGFAPPAGHVDNKGTFENAAKEELEEEVGLKATKLKLVGEGRKENKCRRSGGNWHYWKIYEAEAKGKLKPSSDETKQAGLYSKKQIIALIKKTEQYMSGKISDKDWQKSPGIEIVWYEWFNELKIFKT